MVARSSQIGNCQPRGWPLAVAALWLVGLLAACSPPVPSASTTVATVVPTVPAPMTTTGGSARPAGPTSTALSAAVARPLQDCIGAWETTSVQETILAAVPPDRTGQLVAMAAQLGPDLVYLERLRCGEVGALAARDPAGAADCPLANSKLPGFREAASRGSLSAATAVREVETFARAVCR